MTNFTTVEADSVSSTAGQISGTIKTETSGGNTHANFLIAPSGWSPQVIGNFTLLEDYPDFTDGTNHFKNPPASLNVNYNKYGLSSASNIYGATITANHFIKGIMASSLD